jgi:group I intron endonuclease
MTAQKYLIYGLIDPRTQLVRYVGKSSSGMMRPLEHKYLSRLKESSTELRTWIMELVALGLCYDIVVLEFVPNGNILAEAVYWARKNANVTQLNETERWWVALGRAFGWPLLNKADGGDGSRGWNHTPEARQQMSERRRGEKNAMYGRAHSAETRALQSAAKTGDRHWQFGKPLAESTRVKLRERIITEETREKLRISSTGRTHSDAAKEKNRAAHLGKKPTESARENMRLGQLRRHGKLL